MAERSKALRSGRSLSGGVGSNPTSDNTFIVLADKGQPVSSKMLFTSTFPMHRIRLLNKRMQRGRHRTGCSGSEWLRRWTRNPLGSPRPGSNPADYVDYCIWRVARDCRLSQGDALSSVTSRFQIPLLTGVSSPVVRAPPSFEKELVKSPPRRLQESVKDVCCI